MTIISESLDVGNRFFIYRDNSVEVEFTIENNMIKTMYNLTPEEVGFIKENYLKINIADDCFYSDTYRKIHK